MLGASTDQVHLCVGYVTKMLDPTCILGEGYGIPARGYAHRILN